MKKGMSIVSSLALAVCAFAVPAASFAAPPNHHGHDQHGDHHSRHHRSCVTLYENVNFKGHHKTFCSNDNNLIRNHWNDIASSAKVSRGEGVVLYQDINYKGHRLSLRPGKYSDFRKFRLGHHGNWNDVVSSVSIK